jgi:hypothetical protein
MRPSLLRRGEVLKDRMKVDEFVERWEKRRVASEQDKHSPPTTNAVDKRRSKGRASLYKQQHSDSQTIVPNA